MKTREHRPWPVYRFIATRRGGANRCWQATESDLLTHPFEAQALIVMRCLGYEQWHEICALPPCSPRSSYPSVASCSTNSSQADVDLHGICTSRRICVRWTRTLAIFSNSWSRSFGTMAKPDVCICQIRTQHRFLILATPDILEVRG